MKLSIIAMAGLSLTLAAGCGVSPGRGNPPGLTIKSPVPPEKPLGKAEQTLLDELKAMPQGERQTYINAHPRMVKQILAFGRTNKKFDDALARMTSN